MAATRPPQEETEKPKPSQILPKSNINSKTYLIDYQNFTFLPHSLGNGSFGSVAKASYKDQLIALKRIPYVKPICTFAHCNREREIMQYLTEHNAPNVVNIVAYAVTTNNFYLGMEYMRNGDLQHYMHAGHRDNKWSMRYKLMCELTRVMAFLHRHNIMHRDLKAANVLLDKDLNLRLGDFGSAKFIEANSTGSGSIKYCAPEIVDESQGHSANKATDVYALCSVLWEIATWTGRIPFDGYEDADVSTMKKQGITEKVDPKWPRKVAALITWGWKTKPAERPTVDELQVELNTEINTISSKLAHKAF